MTFYFILNMFHLWILFQQALVYTGISVEKIRWPSRCTGSNMIKTGQTDKQERQIDRTDGVFESLKRVHAWTNNSAAWKRLWEWIRIMPPIRVRNPIHVLSKFLLTDWEHWMGRRMRGYEKTQNLHNYTIHHNPLQSAHPLGNTTK